MNVLRSRALGALIGAEVISSFGSQMTFLALPWFVLVTTGSPARTGIVLAAELAPVAVLGIPSGTVVTRVGARRAMLGADLARAPLIAAIPVLHVAGWLSFPLLVVLVGFVGCFHAAYFGAQRVVLPELVGEDEQRVGQANALVEGGGRLAALAGPATAGVLIAAVGVTNVIYIDAVTYVAAFVLVKLFVPPRPPMARSEDSGGVLSGLRFLVRDRLDDRIGDRRQHGRSGPDHRVVRARLRGARQELRTAGLLFASMGAGALIGVVAVIRLLPHVRPLRLASVAFVAGALSLWVLALDVPVAVLALTLAVFGAATMLVNAPVIGVLSMRTPEVLRAKVMAAVITVATLAGPLGAVVSGPLIESLGVRALLALVAGAMTASALAFAVIVARQDRDAQGSGLRRSPELG